MKRLKVWQRSGHCGGKALSILLWHEAFDLVSQSTRTVRQCKQKVMERLVHLISVYAEVLRRTRRIDGICERGTISEEEIDDKGTK